MNHVTVQRQSTVPVSLKILRAPCTSHFLTRESITTKDGATYAVFMARPRLCPPPQGYPTLYMLDGDGAFDLLTPELLAGVPHLAIVGIGYDSACRFEPLRRSLDFTPSPDGRGPIVDPDRPERRIGGADLFLDRLCGEIRDHVESRLPVDAGNRAIWGHSLGGLLTLYLHLTRPDAFSRIVAASPSIWWGGEYLLRLEQERSYSGEGVRVDVMLGDAERRSLPGAPVWTGPAPATMELVRRLSQRSGLRVSCRVFEGAGHADSLFRSIPAALETMALLPQ